MSSKCILKAVENAIEKEKEMKAVIIYNSQTGFTKRYAEWIAEETGADCFEWKEAQKNNFDSYETIVFGGWACAGGISKLSWFKKNMEKWEGKKLVAFCVGGNPEGSTEMEATLKSNFTEKELQKVKIFYFPGGMNYEKMSGTFRMMMKMFVKALKAQKNKTEKDEEMIKVMSSSYDISDKKYIKPMVEYLLSSKSL